MKTVLDTTAFSSLMRRDTGMVQFLRAYRPGDIATVPLVVAEISYGIARLEAGSRRRLLLEQEKNRILELVRQLDWVPRSSELFGTIKAQLERDGTPIDDMDIAIAAIAMSHQAEVITANMVHFSRIKGLTVRHWTDSSR